MKLESEHVMGVQSPPRKSYNPFDSDDDFKDTNVFLKSNLNGYDIKSFETNDESLTFHLDSSELSWEEAILGHSQVLSRKVLTDSKGEEVLFRKDIELFTDKTVTECELPELMVCYKDNAYNSVKDIGIDEGMPAHDEVSVKNRDNHDSKNLPAFRGINGNNTGKLPVGNYSNEQQALPYMDGLKARMHDDLDKDFSSQNQPQDSMKDDRQDLESKERRKSVDKCGTNDSTKVDDYKFNSIKDESVSSLESSEDQIKTGSVVYSTTDPELSKTDELSYRVLEEKHDNISAEGLSKDTAPLENSQKSSTMCTVSHSPVAGSESTESQEEGATSSQHNLPASEEVDGVVSNVLPYNSKVESGSIILDFISLNIEGEEENKKSQQNEAVMKPPEAQTMSTHDENSPNSILNPGMDNRAHRETSFSSTMPRSAYITYMGPYANAGNISLRSESSAGSTRSFAFPVLQAEWNSSPVRMAKSEQKSFHKQRGWIHSVMCCRF